MESMYVSGNGFQLANVYEVFERNNELTHGRVMILIVNTGVGERIGGGGRKRPRGTPVNLLCSYQIWSDKLLTRVLRIIYVHIAYSIKNGAIGISKMKKIKLLEYTCF